MLTGTPAPTPDPYGSAVQQAVKQYPWLSRFAPMSLTSGSGPFESESYMPHAADNPNPGHYTVQLRSEKQKSNPQGWPTLLAREGVDWLARSDPEYQKTAQAFRQSMTDAQLKNSRRRYQQDLKENPPPKGSKPPTFDDWMHEAELQEYIGGYLVPEIGNWTGPKGEGQYTEPQRRMLDQLKAYLGGN